MRSTEVLRRLRRRRSESPEPAEPLAPAEEPDLPKGPHFFYGLQWWFFGALAVFGFGYLAWDERRKLRAGDPATVRAEARDGAPRGRRGGCELLAMREPRTRLPAANATAWRCPP